MAWMLRPLGMKYCEVVILSEVLNGSGLTICTRPFPNVVSPTMTARS
jgi:hypothetical protein